MRLYRPQVFIFMLAGNRRLSRFHTNTTRQDFQAGLAKDISRIFKEKDGQAMVNLLTQVKDFKSYQSSVKSPLSITDIGGGSGDMLPYFLPLASRIIININETDATRRAEYAHKVSIIPRVSPGRLIPEKMQTALIPPSDIILACHSLYYNTEQWWRCDATQRSIFFKRMLASLLPQGVFCVILQSSAATTLSKKGGGYLPNLEALEDIVYPLISKLTSGKAIDNQHRSSFANAEMLIQALKKYNQSLPKNKSLFWRASLPIIGQVPLAGINFNLNPLTGRYDQPLKIDAILNFYSRGLYNPKDPQKRGFSPQQQKVLLDYIAHHCQDLAGNHSIVHVNKAMVIMPEKSQFTI
jgi:hypothetical protein